MGDINFEENLKAIAVEFVTKQIVMALAKRLPFLGGGIFGWLASFVIAKVVKIALEETILGVKLGVIRVKVSHQVKDYDEAVNKYRLATSDKEREVIENEIKDAARKLINFS